MITFVLLLRNKRQNVGRALMQYPDDAITCVAQAEADFLKFGYTNVRGNVDYYSSQQAMKKYVDRQQMKTYNGEVRK